MSCRHKNERVQDEQSTARPSMSSAEFDGLPESSTAARLPRPARAGRDPSCEAFTRRARRGNTLLNPARLECVDRTLRDIEVLRLLIEKSPSCTRLGNQLQYP